MKSELDTRAWKASVTNWPDKRQLFNEVGRVAGRLDCFQVHRVIAKRRRRNY